MYWFLLKKIVPFTLTFIFGAALSGLTGLFGASQKKPELVSLRFTWGMEEGRGHCRMRHHNLVAESKSLNILSIPDARWPKWAHYDKAVLALVTFGADGNVQRVEPANADIKDVLSEISQQRSITHIDMRPFIWDAAERAARQIQFEPELLNGVPVTVTKEVEIHFIGRD